MENKYDKVMKNIEVTTEMRDRILNNINHLDWDKSPKKFNLLLNYRKYLTIAACLIVLVIGVTIIQNTSGLPSEPPVEMAPAQGIVEYRTMAELSEQIGFTVKEIQEFPFTVNTAQYTLYFGNLAEVNYVGQNNTATFRMARGAEDISGYFDQFTSIEHHVLNANNVTIKGDNGEYRLAIWQNNGYSYSVQFVEGVSRQEILHTIQSIN